MTHPVRFLLLVLAAVPAAGCQFATGPDLIAPVEETLFFLAFEELGDLEGWHGQSPPALVDDAPKGGGTRTALVAGGCVMPHAQLDLGPLSTGGDLRLTALARTRSVGGWLMLENLSTGRSVGLPVQDAAWRHLVSEDALPVRAGDRLRLHMSAGGIVPGDVLVEHLAVHVETD